MMLLHPPALAVPPESGQGGLLLCEATGEAELEAVFRFRYEHHFRQFPTDFPGVDHAKAVAFEPHDLNAAHYCVRAADDSLLAVSTSIPALHPGIPPAWPAWFGFRLLGGHRLGRTVVNTRMVLHPDMRGTGFFLRFRLAVLLRCRQDGFFLALHYCSPELAPRYESLGHRLHHGPFRLPSGELRVPMVMDLRDLEPPAGSGAPQEITGQEARPA
jgi:hypothetical protein